MINDYPVLNKNSSVFRIQKDILKAKGRKEHSLFPLEGPKIIAEALKRNWPIDWLILEEDFDIRGLSQLFDNKNGQASDDNSNKANIKPSSQKLDKNKQIPHNDSKENKRLSSEDKQSHFLSESNGKSSNFSDISADPVFLTALKMPKIYRISKKLFPLICDAESPQGLVGAAKNPPKIYDFDFENMSQSIKKGPLILLANLQDPGNVGAIIRCSAALGAEAIISIDGAEIHNPKTVRATAGAIFALPVYNLKSWPQDFPAIAEKLKSENWTIAGTGIGNTEIERINPARGILLSKQKDKIVLILGSEGSGLPRWLAEICDFSVDIVMERDIESLNVAVACGIILAMIRD